ncbi:hypothetical protein Salat_2694200 [Sesamum alatum]|uniref:Uncharacterized protein n=1 Tax=Sesamum alatum TaxID=300844 RepID=A0AAE1XPX4_9LAMI|nr:hypothetical protein Salat_2694200 [Sesamum alatum]
MKMAEVERKMEEEQREEEEEEGSTTSVLAGLNLVMILSSLSVSDEESLNFEEVEEREIGGRNCNTRGRRGVSRPSFPTRRHETNEFRAVERQMAKAQTKIRDCRHSRKM